MEDAPRLTSDLRHDRARVAAALGLVALAWIAPGAAMAAEDPAAEVTEAVRRLGPPAFLWGRLAAEEESPDGPWTPLSGIEVEVYPAVPSFLAELERIRRSARESGPEYESAVSRLQAALAVHRTRIETLVKGGAQGRLPTGREADNYRGELAQSPSAVGTGAPGPAGDGQPGGAKPSGARRQTTDAAGLFVFDDLPSGDWLLVAIRITPLAQSRGRSAPRALSPSRARNFLPSATSPTKEGEVWLATVRLTASGRTALVLTDRARWMVGPVP
jgi:hypothetical protein